MLEYRRIVSTLNLPCFSYFGNILSHHSFLGQLKPILNIVTVPFNNVLYHGRKCSSKARNLLLGGMRFHYRPRCRLSYEHWHGFHQLSTRMRRQDFESTMKMCLVMWRCQISHMSIYCSVLLSCSSPPHGASSCCE